MGMSTFEPHEMDLETGQQRLQAALSEAGLDLNRGIITSRDPQVQKIREKLRIERGPGGGDLWQLPVILRNALIFLSVHQPNATVPEHQHAAGTVFRMVISGSIISGGTELTAGEWMYVPKGQPYSFQAGSQGATLLYPHSE
jgi:quercetin dioxygenase-like cupin family protein